MANSEIRVGRVSSVNYETGMARITYWDKDETVTSEFPMLNYNNEYRMPEVGQDVMVAHLSNGTSRGVILGTLWNERYAPLETGAALYRKDFSREKDAAYVRYDDKLGEYLIKVANLHLNGVNTTILDGPKVEISANLSILLQTERWDVEASEVQVTAGEADAVNLTVKTDVALNQEENGLEATILKVALKLLESLEIEAQESVSIKGQEGVELQSESKAEIMAGDEVTISSGGNLNLSDGEYSTTLKEIMERLEKLEGG